MIYPTISEYIESIKYAEDNFATLTNLRPVLDDEGNLVMSSGNFAVVFKMKDEQTRKMCAVKCFLREQEGRDEAYRMISEELEYVNSTYLTPIKYLKRELFVNTSSSTETEFPVLIMDWVEGVTLDKYIRKHINDKYELSMLAYQFSRLAMWLMPQPFAHGDLKPDNILVRQDGTLVLVDYDGMYVPAMKGQKARELGSPDFRHPQRTEEDFDEHIDDFSLAVILLSLKAISLQPSLLEEYGAKDRLLFSIKDYCEISKSHALSAMIPLMQDIELAMLQSLFVIAVAQKNLSQVYLNLFNISEPDKLECGVEILSTKVTDEDISLGFRDEYGAIYSSDRKRLLRGADNKKYIVRDGTKVICDSAFLWCMNLTSVTIPNSVTSIGNWAFCGCGNLINAIIPNSVTNIGHEAFSSCIKLTTVNIPNSVKNIGNNPFVMSGVKQITCHSPFFEIDEYALYTKDKNKIIALLNKNITYFEIPNSVTSISDMAFSGCSSLTSVNISNSVKSIGNWAFSVCENLTTVIIPNSVKSIGERAFVGCKNLITVNIPNSVKSIGNMAFGGCRSLRLVNIPNSVKSIGDSTFEGCVNLTALNIPNSVKSIGEGSFEWCTNLTTVNIPESVTSIGYNAFFECENLTTIYIPNGTKSKFESMLPRSLHSKLKEQ